MKVRFPLIPLKRAFSGFSHTVKSLALYLLFALGIGLVSFLVVFPLWYFSTHFRQAYTLFVLLVLGLFGLYLIARKTIRSSKEHGGALMLIRKRIGPLLGHILLILFLLASLYGILLLYSRGIFAAAIPLSAIYLMLVGYLRYARAARSREE